MTQPGIEPRSPGPLVNTLLIRPISKYKDLEKEIEKIWHLKATIIPRIVLSLDINKGFERETSIEKLNLFQTTLSGPIILKQKWLIHHRKAGVVFIEEKN